MTLRETVFQLIEDSEEPGAAGEALLGIFDHATACIDRGNDGRKTARIRDLTKEIASYIQDDDAISFYWWQERRGPDRPEKETRLELHPENGASRICAPVRPGAPANISLDYQDGDLVLILNRDDGPQYDVLLRIQETEVLVDAPKGKSYGATK